MVKIQTFFEEKFTSNSETIYFINFVSNLDEKSL